MQTVFPLESRPRYCCTQAWRCARLVTEAGVFDNSEFEMQSDNNSPLTNKIFTIVLIHRVEPWLLSFASPESSSHLLVD